MKEKIIVTLPSVNDLPDAVRAGADEVLMGVKGFACGASSMFDEKEIRTVLAEAESSHVRAALLINRLFHENELSSLSAFLKNLPEGISHLYFSDPAVLEIAREENIPVPLVYTSDTLITSREDIEAWQYMGALGCVLSPLMTLEETARILAGTQHCVLPVHGRCLMSRSERKLLTAWDEQYEKNIHPEGRMGLSIKEAKRSYALPVYEDEYGTSIYTDYVLCSLKELSSLPLENHTLLIHSVFMERSALFDAVRAYRCLLNGGDPDTVYEAYVQKHPEEHMTGGYYHEKTVR